MMAMNSVATRFSPYFVLKEVSMEFTETEIKMFEKKEV